MGRSGCGLVAGMIAFGISFPGLGFVLFAMTGVAFAGDAVGENNVALVIYLFGAMVIAYGAPICAACAAFERHIALVPIWFVGGAMATSLVFAVPSSFVAMAGCEAGNDKAIWAMRAIPVLAVGELLAPKDEKLSCARY